MKTELKITLVTMFLFVLLLTTSVAQAQLLFPANSQTDFFFAHLTDGGPFTDRWTTLIHVMNPDPSFAATGTIYFYTPDGSPLLIDFGGGPSSSLSITLPPYGMFQAESTGAPSDPTGGWAWGSFDSPVKATEEFRNWRNGGFANGASVEGIQPSQYFWTPGDYYTGIAIANPFSAGAFCTGSFLNSDGSLAAQRTILLLPLNETAFNIRVLLSLPPTATGSFQIACDVPVVSLAIAGNDKGITSSLPSGAAAAPTLEEANIQRIFKHLVKTLNGINIPQLAVGNPSFQIFGDPLLNVWTNNGAVNIELGLAELVADSPSELAAVLAHELGHIHQQTAGSNPFNADPELDADTFSVLALLGAGYDPYALSGVLGKLTMLTGTTNILPSLWENTVDPKTSFSSRMANIYSEIQFVCSQAAPVLVNCRQVHALEHPYLNAPLGVKPKSGQQ